MTAEDKSKAPESTEGGSQRSRLSGHFELDLPEAEHATKQSEKRPKTFGSRLTDDLKKPRFWLEIAALVIVGVYTYQARRANQFTQEIVRSTISASVFCAVSSGFSHMGSSDAPMTGAFYVQCNNQGKVSAQRVSGKFTLTAKSFPDERILYSEFWPFGGNDSDILGNDAATWPFSTPKYSPETEPQLITAGKEIIIGDVALSFADETGETVNRRFCRVEMNWANLGGSPDSWTTCQTLTAEKAILTKPRATHE